MWYYLSLTDTNDHPDSRNPNLDDSDVWKFNLKLFLHLRMFLLSGYFSTKEKEECTCISKSLNLLLKAY